MKATLWGGKGNAQREVEFRLTIERSEAGFTLSVESDKQPTISVEYSTYGEAAAEAEAILRAPMPLRAEIFCHESRRDHRPARKRGQNLPAWRFSS